MAFKYAIALTGGIATGKSSVLEIFSLYGFDFIDADKVAHEILDEQADTIAKMFGTHLVKGSKVDRKALGSIIFADATKRSALESLLHPLIYDEIEKQAIVLDALEKPYMVDIPLFFEGGRYPIERTLVVYASREQQLERLMQRDGYSKVEALNRIASQMDIEAKRKRAKYVIDNSGDLKQLGHECKRIKDDLEKEFG